MDPQYQQMMVQALMGGKSMPPGMAGQNPSTPYGSSFLTGNMMTPQPQAGMLGTAPPAASTQLQQPFAQYPLMQGAQQMQGY